MKETVDLTEHRLFSSGFHTEDMEVRHKFELPCYKHKDVPWERTGKGELAKPINLFSKTNVFKSSFLVNNNMISVNSDDDLFTTYGIEDLTNYTDSISFSVQRSRTSENSSVFPSTFIYTDRNVFVPNISVNSNYHLGGYNIVKCNNGQIVFSNQNLGHYGEESLRSAMDISGIVPKNSQIFPTGHKEEIIKARKPYQSYDTERDLRSRLRTVDSKIRCKICGKSVFRKEYDRKFLWETDLCESCFNKNFHVQDKLTSSSEYFMNRFIRDEAEEYILREVHKYAKTPTRISECVYESGRGNGKKNDERNCLLYFDSFYDEPEVHKYQKNNYNKFYLMRGGNPILGRKNSKNLIHFDQAVYFKGRDVGRGEEPWQPSGRKRQWYDSLFDSMDWKDLFKKKTDSLLLQ